MTYNLFGSLSINLQDINSFSPLEIFPDFLLAESMGISCVEQEISRIVDRVNISLNSDRQIDSFRIRETPFKRTSTGKIKRSEFYF